MTYIKPNKGPFPPEADQGRSRMDQPKPAQDWPTRLLLSGGGGLPAADDTALRNSISKKMDDEGLSIGVQAVVFRILREVGVLK